MKQTQILHVLIKIDKLKRTDSLNKDEAFMECTQFIRCKNASWFL